MPNSSSRRAPPFSACSRTLCQLLGGEARFQIPDYQRAYAWTAAEAGRLLDDVVSAQSEGADDDGGGPDGYFLGAIVLMEMSAEDRPADPGAPAYQIVDGLQRLITLTILLAVARDLVAGTLPQTAQAADACIASRASGAALSHPRIELADDTRSFFEAFVQAPGASAEMPDTDDLTDVESRILDVREHLMHVLVDLTGEQIEKLVHFLLEHCHAAVVTARTIDRAHQIFCVLNDRGLPLARGDILKARLLGEIASDRRPHYSEKWVALERQLGSSFEDLLGHIRTIEGRSRSSISDDIRAVVSSRGGAEPFIDRILLPNGAILVAIRSAGESKALGPGRPGPGRLHPDIARRIGYLDWLGIVDWVPPLMLWWRLTDGAVDRLDAFLARLDRLAYGLRFLGLGADKRALRYKAVLDAIRAGSIETPGSALDLSREEQRLVLYNMRNLHVRNQLACKLLLLRVNDELAGCPQGFDIRDLTVEHILPQRPPRDSQWHAWFPDPHERQRCTQSLGNMILVTQEKNARARNRPFADKLAAYFSDAPNLPASTRELEGTTEWSPESIMCREERIMASVMRIWQIGAGKSAGRGQALDPNPRAVLRPRHGGAAAHAADNEQLKR